MQKMSNAGCIYIGIFQSRVWIADTLESVQLPTHMCVVFRGCFYDAFQVAVPVVFEAAPSS